MPQITIYLDEETEKRARTAAESSGASLSKWIAGAIHEKTVTTWPQHVLDLAGSWPDFPDARKLRRNQKKDSLRESL
jgi:hypothetical protein